MSDIKLQAYKKTDEGIPNDITTGYSYPDSILAGVSWEGDSDEKVCSIYVVFSCLNACFHACSLFCVSFITINNLSET